MATRPIFIPQHSGTRLVEQSEIHFAWFPGMSLSQKRRSIKSLHDSAMQTLGVERILEISSKSDEKIGTELSAFNLSFCVGKLHRRVCVECAFQGSKVFEEGGPYIDLYGVTPREAKRDERLLTSGRLLGFRFFGREWPLVPLTAFYDWLYINALLLNKELADGLIDYSAFTDIEFNPKRSINCQANSAALYVALQKRALLDTALESKEAFISILQEHDYGSGTNSGETRSLF